MRKHRETARRENEEILKGIKRHGDISQINRNLQKNKSNYMKSLSLTFLFREISPSLL